MSEIGGGSIRDKVRPRTMVKDLGHRQGEVKGCRLTVRISTSFCCREKNGVADK